MMKERSNRKSMIKRRMKEIKSFTKASLYLSLPCHFALLSNTFYSFTTLEEEPFKLKQSAYCSGSRLSSSLSISQFAIKIVLLLETRRDSPLAMAAAGDQQPWVPYVPTRDCSVGFCSIYCPQWCYIIFPPPPPAELSGDGSGVAFSPFVIAIIGVLAGAFLLVCYYALFSKYCGSLDSLLRWLHAPGGDGRGSLGSDAAGQSRRHEDAWLGSPANGLDETLISKITVYKYRKGDGVAQGADCAVCLGEFREHDSLRLLPKCSHAFHLECIDTWLRSHSNCPLCRANIVPLNPPPAAAPEPEHGIEVEEAAIASEVVVVVEDEEQAESGRVSDAAKGDAIVEIRDDESTEVSHCGRVSIADVLRMSMEDELLAAKEGGFWTGPSSSRRAAAAGEHHRKHRGLHSVTSPVPMKRTFSNGRFCLAARNGRARNELPVEEASES